MEQNHVDSINSLVKQTTGGLTTEGKLKRSGGIMKHGEFIIIPFEHTELNVRPVGTDVVVTSIK